jgi:hypothetical protein
MPAGGSCINRLKSLINRFLAGVDILRCLCATNIPLREPKDHKNLSLIHHHPAPSDKKSATGLTTQTKMGGKTLNLLAPPLHREQARIKIDGSWHPSNQDDKDLTNRKKEKILPSLPGKEKKINPGPADGSISSAH